MFPKPKSAPPTVNNKRISNKTNAMKEIEAWVKKDDDPLIGNHETSRMAGQLTDNITEERMLKAKLWELSKERYKFIAQNSYEKKIFMDRMMKKSSAIRRVLSAKEEKPHVTYSRIKCTNGRHALLERLDPTKCQDKWLGMSTVKPFLTSLPPTPPVSETKSVPNNRVPTTVSDYSDTPTLPAVRKDTPTPSHHRDLLERRKPDRKGYSLQTCRNDPRYSELHQRLCPVVNKPANGDIYTVVTKIESLHVKPKLPTDCRTKFDKKAVAYMRKRGFVFP